MKHTFNMCLLVSATLTYGVDIDNTINSAQPNITDLVTTHKNIDLEQQIVRLVTYINKGNRIIHDTCEVMEERVGILSGSDKPKCRYNASFIDNSNIFLFNVDNNIREFFLTRKREHCKNSESECGELTINLKMVDLINSIVHISLQVSNLSDLFKNLEAISFYELFDAYVSSLNNEEILANITLRKDRVISILEKERLRIKRINSRTGSEQLFESVNYYIGAPIKASVCYVGDALGSSIGTMIGSAIEGTSGGIGISTENKMILVGLVSLYLLRR